MPQETQEGPGVFSGLKEVLPAFISDWVLGGETGVKAVIRNNAMDWRPSAPDPKGQLMKVNGVSYGDTNSCTDFSGTNDVATQLDYMIKNGQIDPNGLNFLKNNGYVGEDGKINLSPRFTAVMSGTTPQNGNSLPNVWHSMRHNGVVPDSAWPMPTTAFSTTLDSGGGIQALWNDYYAPISQDVIDLGAQFASWFDIQYEWVAWPGGGAQSPSDFSQALSVSPLQIATAVCAGWNTADPIQACGPGCAHATTLLYVDPSTNDYDILDHYNPWMKQFSPSYSITYAMRGVITSKAQNVQAPPPVQTFTYDYQVNLALGVGAPSEIHALQEGLQTLLDKNGKPYMMRGVFGPYGPQTAAALGRFQVDHGIADEPQGHDFGPQSRAALTQALLDNAQSASGAPLPRPLDPGAHHPN